MDNQKNNFIFHRNWWDSLHNESNELIGAFTRDLCQYAFCGEDSEPLPELRLLVRHAKAEMELDVKRYQETCERNRQKALSRWNRVKDTTACKSMPQHTTAYSSIPTDAENADNDNDNELSKDNNSNKENTKRNREIQLPDNIDPAFIPAMKEWAEYKKERGDGYKPKGLKMCYSRLLNLSGKDPVKAMAIVEQSMACNYSGLFQLKDNSYVSTNNFAGNRPTPADNIFAAQEAHIRSIRDSIGASEDRPGEVQGYIPNT